MTDSEKEYLMAIGSNIARLRKAKGLSQLDVCSIVGMEKSYLSSIENGHQNVTSLKLKSLADAIETSVLEFFKDL